MLFYAFEGGAHFDVVAVVSGLCLLCDWIDCIVTFGRGVWEWGGGLVGGAYFVDNVSGICPVDVL